MPNISKWLSASIGITILVLLLFGTVFVYQDMKIREQKEELERRQIALEQAQELIRDLNEQLADALEEPEPVPVFQRVQIPDAGVTMLIPDGWGQPTFARSDDLREFGEGLGTTLTVDVGLETEAVITYKSNDYAPGRESAIPEVFGSQLDPSIDAFCDSTPFDSEPMGTCEVITLEGQRYAMFTVGSHVSLASPNRRVFFGVVGTLPGAPYTLFNFWAPLSDTEFTPEEMNTLFTGLRNEEVNTLVTQEMLDRLGRRKAVVRSLTFSTPVAMQNHQLLEHVEDGYAFYAPPEWPFQVNPSKTAFTATTSNYNAETGMGIYVTVGKYKQLGRDAAGPVVEIGERVVNGVVAKYTITEGQGVDDTGAVVTDRIITMEHNGETYTFEMITGAENADLIAAFDTLVDSFHFTK